MPQGYAERMADCVFKIEGGSKTRWPYGVKSVKVSGEAEARRVTINSINNGWKRWEAAGKPEPFTIHFARRWCPPSADPVGFRNWTNNITKMMK